MALTNDTKNRIKIALGNNGAGADLIDHVEGTTSASDIADDVIFSFGTDSDQAFISRSTTLAATTALTGVVVGTPVTAAIPANSLIISNVTADGDQVWMGQTGGNSTEWLRYDASALLVVINEASADIDFRIESNVLSNFFVIDGNACLNGQLALGGAVPTNPQAFFSILPAVNASGVTANQSYFHSQLLPGAAVTIPTGTAPIVASVNIHEPNITATGTVTDAATLRIADAPTEGGTGNYALWVDGGASRFDGDVVVGAAVIPTNPQAQFAILPQTRTATANQSYFHQQLLATGGAITVPAGTAPVVASLNIHEPNITATGTVTAAATLRIVDAPTEATSNYALWVDAGVSRFDGNLEFNATAAALVGARTAAGTTAAAITGATTLVLADSGGVFSVSQAAAYDIDLPSPTTGPGLLFVFYLTGAAANAVTITVAGGAATFVGTIVNDVTSVIPATGSTLTFGSGAAALGDTIIIRSISTTLYLVQAVTSAASGITIA